MIDVFADSSNADIDKAVLRYKIQLVSELSHIPESETKSAIISSLIERYQDNLVQMIADYPRERSLKFQLNKHNFDAKSRWTDENGYYGGHPGRFYKAILEEYARKSYYR